MIIEDWIDDRREEHRFAALPAGNEHEFSNARRRVGRRGKDSGILS